ncbi:MAG: hypothetical protein JNL74_22220, partial [Fibrobacteres bacterium]|nr:hypothetical protein [Fibrobacterota bacterium]
MLKLFLLLSVTVIIGQVNTWSPAGGNTLGRWFGPALVYSHKTDEFVLTMGSQKSKVYTVQVLPSANGKWINALPNDSLYGSVANANSVDSANGKWADSTGSAYSIGTNDQFGWRPRFANVKGYLRPNLNCDDFGAVTAYSQFCYNRDDGKVYFYLNNQTFTYDPETRLFDTLTTAVHPNNGNLPNAGMGFDKNNKTVYALRWGSLCYDAYNKEIVAFGGGGLDQPLGSIPGTWVFNTTTKSWSKLTQSVVPSPRAHSPMVYDSVNRCIVMFGGDHLDCLMNDTWIYDCVTKVWTKKNPTVRPKPRAGHALIYLPKSKKIVMMGGYRFEANQTNEFEMWVYSVSENSWSLIKRFATSDLRPKLTLMKPAFCGLAAVNSGDTVVAIGDSILSDFSNNPYAYKMAIDASVTDVQGTAQYGLSRDTLAVAGATYDPAYWYGLTKSDSASRETALSAIPQNAWTLVSPPATPGGDRTWGSIVMDTERDRIIKRGGGHAAYCGSDLPNYFITENRWNIGYRPEFPLEMNGNNEPSPGPFTFNDRPFMPTHPVKAMVYDPIIKKALLIELLYTYVYDPDSMDFVKGSRIPAPVPSGGSQSTYGQGTCTTPYGAYDLCVNQGYLFSADSMRWRKLPQTGVTLPNYYADCAGLTYDSKRDRIVYAHQAYGNMT